MGSIRVGSDRYNSKDWTKCGGDLTPTHVSGTLVFPAQCHRGRGDCSEFSEVRECGVPGSPRHLVCVRKPLTASAHTELWDTPTLCLGEIEGHPSF